MRTPVLKFVVINSWLCYQRFPQSMFSLHRFVATLAEILLRALFPLHSNPFMRAKQ